MAENIKCKNEINVDIIKESMNDCFVVSDDIFICSCNKLILLMEDQDTASFI